MDIENMGRDDLLDVAQDLDLEIEGTGANGYVTVDDLRETIAAAHDDDADDVDEVALLRKQVEQLSAALAAATADAQLSRKMAEGKMEEPVHPVEWCKAGNVTLVLQNAEGDKRVYRFTNDTPRAMMTASEIEQARRKAPEVFDGGLVRVEGDIVPDTANHIGDFDEFYEALDPDAIDDRIAEIDSQKVLWRILGEIERRRFSAVDEDGNPFMENGRPILREQDIPAKMRLLHGAVRARIEKLSDATSPEGRGVRIVDE